MILDPKREIVTNYIEYRQHKERYANQNFWFVITGFLLLISLSLLTAAPWVLFHYVSFGITGLSLLTSLVTIYKNRGVITPRFMGKVKYHYYSELDRIVDSLIDEEDVTFFLRSVHSHNLDDPINRP